MQPPEPSVPPTHDWRTTDEDEINRRKKRAREEFFSITNLNPKHRILSNFRVGSGSGMDYSVEIRDLRERRFACTCVDFRSTRLGTCKHVEAVLLNLEHRFKRLFAKTGKNGPSRSVVELDREADTLRLTGNGVPVPAGTQRWFAQDGLLRDRELSDVSRMLNRWNKQGLDIWISQEIAPWLESRHRAEEALLLRREYEIKVQSGEWPPQETNVPLFPYQREGMLHLAFKERALLADEMGLGKTIQAIAACALLHRLGKAQHALVVTPASLKTEWEEQIQAFTSLPHHVVFGPKRKRLQEYAAAPFFTIVNYEQMMVDALDVNQCLQPDIVILDEAQRIKNWNTKTAQAIKRLRSRYAFVLTGTPIENRIDELHSIMDFLNPEVLGPLFRFNRDFYQLDDRGRPAAYRNLDLLHQRVAPSMIRRRKSDVETELPRRTDHNRFVQMNEGQWLTYLDHKKGADRLLATARKRPLRRMEMDILQRELATMRMICDTNFILDPQDRSCPKLEELERILEEAAANGAKVIVFSEWERMLQLVRELCRKLGMGFAWHTGKVPQKKRRGEINAFKQDPQCRVFLSTDSGSTGLNLQTASVVVNCDLPWNPAKLEQRIARAWRKNQTQAVTVLNLVSENTIEHGMLDTLASKQALSDGVLDQLGDVKNIQLRGGRQAFLDKLQQLVSKTSPAKRPHPPTAPPADRPRAFAEQVHAAVGGALLRCEERYPADGDHTVLLVVVQNSERHAPNIDSLYQTLFRDQVGREDAARLEIIDQRTAEALERLQAAGLFAPTFRSSRPLFPIPTDGTAGTASLAPEEERQIRESRAQAERSLKMAFLLGQGGFSAEARSPLLQALHETSRALAIENHLPIPGDPSDSVRPPLARLWAESLATLEKFVKDDQTPWEPTAGLLKTSLSTEA